MTIEQILLTKGVIIDLCFTYDLINKFQVVVTINDSCPDTYYQYLKKVRLQDPNFDSLIARIEILLESKHLLDK